jgi:hypothetical protein
VIFSSSLGRLDMKMGSLGVHDVPICHQLNDRGVRLLLEI